MGDWEECYLKNDTPWDKGKPSPGLEDFLASDHAKGLGTVCIPGCGMGHDVRAWSRAGFTAVGYDIAPSAVCRAQTATGSSDGNSSFVKDDFLTASPPHLFDWIFEHTFYCAIQPSERPAYLQAILRHLKPGGYFLAVHYMIPDQDGPPFGTTPEEVLARFSPSLTLLKEWEPRSYPNRRGLERMFWWQKPPSCV